MAAGSGSEESALEELTGTLHCLTGGTRDDLAGGGKDVPNEALEHRSKACGRVVVGMVVQAAAADSGFMTPGSTPLLSVGEPISRQSSLSRHASVLMTGRSRFVQGPPSPERGLKGRECDCSWWEGQPCESCLGCG